MVKVLVTGAGGIFGEATIRSLNKSNLETYIIAADCESASSGFYLSNEYYIIPKVSDNSYSDYLIDICVTNNVDIVFICSGLEISMVCHLRDKIERLSGSFVIVNSPELIRLTYDKWTTHQYLYDNNIILPESTIDKDYEKLSNFVKQVGFPLIVKPRSGSGSKDLHIVNNMKSLFHFMNLDISMIAQRVVGSKDDEYTVGVIGTESGDILDLIVLKRLLKSGLTSMAKVVKNHKIEDYAKSIVSLLKPRGYCNVQLRLENGNPYVFEVNGRISSSTGFRTTAGFNEPEIIIRHYLFKEKIIPSKLKNVRLVRVHDEIVI